MSIISNEPLEWKSVTQYMSSVANVKIKSVKIQVTCNLFAVLLSLPPHLVTITQHMQGSPKPINLLSLSLSLASLYMSFIALTTC